MSDTFVSAIPIQMLIPAASLETSSTALGAERYPIPFNYELLGAYVTVGVAPTKVALVFDVLRLPVESTAAQVSGAGSAVSVWATTAAKPTIAVNVFDCGALVAPTAAGSVASVLEGPIVDPGGSIASGQTAAQENATAWGTGYQPGVLAPGTYPNDFGDLTTPVAQSAGSPWAQPSGSSALVTSYLGSAGDIFQWKVLTGDYSGSAGAAANGVLTLWVTKR